VRGEGSLLTQSTRKAVPRVLVVDGRRDWRNALSESLGSTFDVVTARSPEGALGGLDEYRPRVVVLAEQQDGAMDGLQLVAALRSDARTKSCLLVVYGGVQVDEETAKSVHGVDEYLGKGGTLKELSEAVCRHLRLGWSPMASAGGIEEEESGRWKNPLTEEKVMSARKSETKGESTKKSLFSRLFRS
jgi:PleD family two-component response regulator